MKYLLLLLLMPATVLAQKKKTAAAPDQNKIAIAKDLDQQYSHYKDVAMTIWDYAEVGYKEVKSSALLQEELKGAGFRRVWRAFPRRLWLPMAVGHR